MAPTGGRRETVGQTTGALAAWDIRNHLGRVLSSENFAGKKRLCDLLRFLVEETLEGREAEIKGFTVGYKVFGLGTEFDPHTNSIVRVGVKRLRAALAEYYQTTGVTDPVRISLPVGSYTPQFTLRSSLRRTLDPETESLYNDANALLNPPSSKARLLAGRKLFEFLTEVEPNFPGGFCGAAVTYCHAVLFGHSDQRLEDLEEAIRLAKCAIAIEDGFATGHAVLGLALVLLGDRDRGLQEADRGIAVEPANPWAHIWRALTYCIVGEPEEAIRGGQKAVLLEKDNTRSPCWNVLGLALLLHGQHQRAREAFIQNVEQGGPDGPHMMALRAIAFSETGCHQKARSEVDKLRQEFPYYSVRQWLSNFSDRNKIQEHWLALLGDLGLTDN